MPPRRGSTDRRHERQREVDRDLREHHAERRAHERQHDRFRQQLTHDPPASRAEGHADGQFAAARGEVRHLQVRDVDAGDQEHEPHRPAGSAAACAPTLAVLLQAHRAREPADVRGEHAFHPECAPGTIDESFASAVNSASACSCVMPAFMRPRQEETIVPGFGPAMGRKMSSSAGARSGSLA